MWVFMQCLPMVNLLAFLLHPTKWVLSWAMENDDRIVCIAFKGSVWLKRQICRDNHANIVI